MHVTETPPWSRRSGRDCRGSVRRFDGDFRAAKPGARHLSCARCIRSAAAGGTLAAEQILRVDIQGEPPTLDPNKAQDSNSLTVLRALHRPLVYIDPETLEPVPALAESWEISEDAKTLTFTLKDAQYSNGDPIVAGDLVYGWRRLVDPRTAAPYSYVLAEVEGAAELLGMDPREPAVRRRD